MNFKEYKPDPLLSNHIVNYWSITCDDKTILEQKVVPDGYPELIFHCGDNYEIKLFNKWELQDNFLFSGQIRNHFYLRNTGDIKVFGIKFQPWTPHQLFNVNMVECTDKVVSVSESMSDKLIGLEKVLKTLSVFDLNINSIDLLFLKLLDYAEKETKPIKLIIEAIINSRGQIKIDELVEYYSISRRSLERRFKEVIGLSPKYYSRIIRFNNIFKLIQSGDTSWCQVAMDSGYYDQAHFIREFKTFTGETPSAYGFDENTIANFFLKRQ